jgi:Xaa-Pro aminopeptidase
LAHRKPSNRKVEPGDIVIIDFSLKYDDYVSDIARTFYFLNEGETEAPMEIENAFRTAHQAITSSIEALSIGKRGYEVDAVGRRVIEEAGYPTIRHSVGHQIGRATHDGGTILGPKRVPARPAVEGIIRAGEVYAIEPTVIQDEGLPCMLVEENVLVTNEGPVILSKRQDELLLVKE